MRDGSERILFSRHSVDIRLMFLFLSDPLLLFWRQPDLRLWPTVGLRERHIFHTIVGLFSRLYLVLNRCRFWSPLRLNTVRIVTRPARRSCKRPLTSLQLTYLTRHIGLARIASHQRLLVSPRLFLLALRHRSSHRSTTSRATIGSHRRRRLRSGATAPRLNEALFLICFRIRICAPSGAAWTAL